ncbi:MAG: Hsp33 family molecular chaperone [Rhodospirillaceae bacterium]|nr:Hsp33 family molecular chaperone [Rhodospirillaceae bacterium]
MVFATRPDDLVQPFQIDRFGLRGRIVRLGGVIDTILARHDYPEPLATMLGELIAMTPALAAALKFDGVFSLQIHGDGPVRLMVADCTTDGGLRGYAGYDAERFEKALAEPGAVDLRRFLGKGYLSLTVDQGPDTERYQGIVDLEGSSLADCVRRYFVQSEQIGAEIKAAAIQRTEESGNGWRAGCIMIQTVPQEGGHDSGAPIDEDAMEDAWRRTRLLMDTATTDELTDPDLSAPVLLNRLFSEDGVWVYRPHALSAECRCSNERVLGVLRSFPEEEVADMVTDEGEIVVTCEFCSRRYIYAPSDVVATH